jgi:hypothetical protein
MRKSSFIRVASAIFALCCLVSQAESPHGNTGSPAGPLQQDAAASLNDALLARATALYDSTAKSGLRGFDCQVHPDWLTIMTSARKGAAVPADDPKPALLGTVKITLHARLKGASSLDWQAPASQEKPLDQAAISLLDRTHRGIENTLLGLVKIWIPLVDGSVAESFGEEEANIAHTENGYTLRSKDGSLTEEFDRNLTLKTYLAADASSTVKIAPMFQPTSQGLRLGSFTAHIRPAGASAESAQEMRVGLEYQTVAGVQIPARFLIEMPSVVEMNFKLDGCIVNPK